MIRWLLLLAAVAAPLLAQQSIFDVPSADVSPKGQWFFQHQTVARETQPDRHWFLSNAYGYGVGHNLELDATLYSLAIHRPSLAVSAFGFKWNPRLNSATAKIPTRLVAGEMFTLRKAADGRLGHWSYVMLSAELPRGARLTGGVTTGTTSLFGHKTTAAVAGWEQTLTKRWMFQVDWFSGKNDLGYWIPGFVRRVSDHWMISLGYQVPNRHSDGFHAVVLELTRVPE